MGVVHTFTLMSGINGDRLCILLRLAACPQLGSGRDQYWAPHCSFNIFIKYLDDGIESTFTNFAADAKLGNEVDPSEGKSISERNPDRLEEWAGKNRVKTTAKSMRKD